MTPTDKQISMITYKIESMINNGSQTMKMFWDNFPKNNEKYPNKVADYRRAILEDWIKETKSSKWASYLITLLHKPDLKKSLSMLNQFYKKNYV